MHDRELIERENDRKMLKEIRSAEEGSGKEKGKAKQMATIGRSLEEHLAALETDTSGEETGKINDEDEAALIEKVNSVQFISSERDKNDEAEGKRVEEKEEHINRGSDMVH